jgi:hypothetical protein
MSCVAAGWHTKEPSQLKAISVEHGLEFDNSHLIAENALAAILKQSNNDLNKKIRKLCSA